MRRKQENHEAVSVWNWSIRSSPLLRRNQWWRKLSKSGGANRGPKAAELSGVVWNFGFFDLNLCFDLFWWILRQKVRVKMSTFEKWRPGPLWPPVPPPSVTINLMKHIRQTYIYLDRLLWKQALVSHSHSRSCLFCDFFLLYLFQVVSGMTDFSLWIKTN